MDCAPSSKQRPASKLWGAVYFFYLKFVVPLFGRLFCGDADSYAYILESLKHYPGSDELAQILRRAGWASVESTNFLGGIMSLTVASKSTGAGPVRAVDGDDRDAREET